MMVNNKTKSHAVYKPLISAGSNDGRIESHHNSSDTESDTDQDERSVDSRTRANSRFSVTSRIEDLEEDRQTYYTAADAHQRQFKQFGTNDKVLLAKLRGTLFIVALILFIIFVAQLTTDTQVGTKQRVSPSTEHLQPAKLVAPVPTGVPTPSHGSGLDNHTEAEQSLFRYAIDTATTGSGNTHNNQYTSRASAGPPHHSSGDNVNNYSTFIRGASNEESHNIEDDFNYPGDDESRPDSSPKGTLLPPATNNSNRVRPWWTTAVKNVEHNDNYVIVTDFIRAIKSFNQSMSITLTSQATTEFIYHSLELCKRWDGPMSVAVFCPGQEMSVAITLIQFMRQCLPPPLSACIRDKITWHLVYNRDHGPPINEINYPKHYLDSVNYPLFAKVNQCPKLLGPDAGRSIAQLEEQLRRKNGLYPKNYRKHHRLTYPINVLRNTARLAAKTRYILASDIELYPSTNLVPMFTKFITKHNVKEEYKVDRFIFTLPIFEVKSNITAPYTKKELVALLSSGDAIYFHKFICDWCQNFPNREQWLRTDKANVNNYHAGKDNLVIFETAKRDSMRSSWEPIFIGTNEDPLYDDRLSWEGRRDKMSQMYEMCLLDYHMLVLGNAFLVHAPGIKHMDENEIKSRHSYMTKNNSVYNMIIATLKKKYANSPNINKC